MTEQWVKLTGLTLLDDILLSAVYYNWHSLKDFHQETMFTKEAIPKLFFFFPSNSKKQFRLYRLYWKERVEQIGKIRAMEGLLN